MTSMGMIILVLGGNTSLGDIYYTKLAAFQRHVVPLGMSG
jgi:hypothetical protein